ncbi:MAG: hypothetical protein OK455_10355 [Thaumarchaeota archaeon]|nr:hypothetical protein [Nitrososphaerota archaeon]
METDLLAAAALFPNVNAALGAAFEEAVRGAFANVLDESTVTALLVFIGEDNLSDPQSVFSTNENLLGPGARIMNEKIASEFSLRLHELVTQTRDRPSEMYEVEEQRPEVAEMMEPRFSYSATLTVGYRRPGVGGASGSDAAAFLELDALMASFGKEDSGQAN